MGFILKDGKIEAEDFTSRLYRELNSSPQPYLVPFLKVIGSPVRLSLGRGWGWAGGLSWAGTPVTVTVLAPVKHPKTGVQLSLRGFSVSETPVPAAARVSHWGWRRALSPQRAA